MLGYLEAMVLRSARLGCVSALINQPPRSGRPFSHALGTPQARLAAGLVLVEQPRRRSLVSGTPLVLADRPRWRSLASGARSVLSDRPRWRSFASDALRTSLTSRVGCGRDVSGLGARQSHQPNATLVAPGHFSP